MRGWRTPRAHDPHERGEATTPPDSRRPRSRVRLGGKIVIAAVVLGALAREGLREEGAGRLAADGDAQPSVADTISRPASGTARDWEIAREQFSWAVAQPPGTFPRFGDLVARIGERFVGTPYEPQTLELPGPERLVINLEALDCVTFVENVLVLARLAWAAMPGAADAQAGGAAAALRSGLPDDPDRFQAAYRDELTRIRYRDGVLDGYPSRLHYFSEWIADNEASGTLADVSRELGGVPDSSAIDFMSTHPDAYRQLSDSATLAAIAAVEARLSGEARHYVPQGSIGAVAHGVREGDIIAAASTVAGLDVAHTGIALWRDGELHLLHAPLVGSHVQVSEEPLAGRIGGMRGQDGIMVARPLAPGS